MSRKDKKTGLTPFQKAFCELYASKEFFCNGAQSYIEAYSLDPKTQYNTAKVEASKLLTNPNILDYINSLIEDTGLNDAYVDKQLKKLITQDADMKSKISAIKEYNKLKTRITSKVDVTTNGKEVSSMSPEELLTILKK